ncbi:MAG: hypothetical protein Q8R70_06555 [Methanoregula sp.]|nr:hypothetical protein [Methanoregula sp.]
MAETAGGDTEQKPGTGRGCCIFVKKHLEHNEDAFTGLELVIVIAVLIGAAVILLIFMSGGEMPSCIRVFPEGMVAESAYMSGDHIQPVGSVFGFPAVSGTIGNAEVRFRDPDPGTLGAVRITISLFLGDTGAIDMDRFRVSWAGAGSVKGIGQTSSHLLICPNWTIIGKYNMLPGRSADSDNWLEPGEQFEILVCPSAGVQPYGTFTLTLRPDGSAIPLVVTRTVPPKISPVMNLR